MKQIIIVSIALTGFLMLIGACKKDKSSAKSVEINFTKPTVGDTIPTWNQIHMEGTITGDGEMKGYTISAVNASTNVTLFTKTYDVKAKAYNFHEHWMNSLYDTTTVTVKVEVIKNDEGELETATRNVVCLP
jgi:hypothetical protein